MSFASPLVLVARSAARARGGLHLGAGPSRALQRALSGRTGPGRRRRGHCLVEAPPTGIGGDPRPGRARGGAARPHATVAVPVERASVVLVTDARAPCSPPMSSRAVDAARGRGALSRRRARRARVGAVAFSSTPDQPWPRVTTGSECVRISQAHGGRRHGNRRRPGRGAASVGVGRATPRRRPSCCCPTARRQPGATPWRSHGTPATPVFRSTRSRWARAKGRSPIPTVFFPSLRIWRRCGNRRGVRGRELRRRRRRPARRGLRAPDPSSRPGRRSVRSPPARRRRHSAARSRHRALTEGRREAPMKGETT